MRGLDALTVLNLRDGATVSEVAHEIHLPRTTVYRILETLCNTGFVFRDAADDRYRLTILVRGLSEGFEDESWAVSYTHLSMSTARKAMARARRLLAMSRA